MVGVSNCRGLSHVVGVFFCVSVNGKEELPPSVASGCVSPIATSRLSTGAQPRGLGPDLRGMVSALNVKFVEISPGMTRNQPLRLPAFLSRLRHLLRQLSRLTGMSCLLMDRERGDMPVRNGRRASITSPLTANIHEPVRISPPVQNLFQRRRAGVFTALFGILLIH